MVDMIKVLDITKYPKKETQLFEAVKDLSKNIGEASGTSTFITAEDALNSSTDIFLIEDEKKEEKPIIRRFVLV